MGSASRAPQSSLSETGLMRPRAMLLLGVVGLTSCAAGSGAPELVAAPAATTASAAGATRTQSFRSTSIGRDVVGADPLTDEEARGQWHDEVFLENGRAVRVERLGPSSLRSSITYIEHEADGTARFAHLDAYGVVAYTDRLTRAGVRSRTYRSGVASERGCAELQETYESHGLVVSVSCLDEQAHIVTDLDGCPVHRFTYDERLHLKSEACFAESGSPATFRRGGQVTIEDYDARGYRERVARKNADGSAAVNDTGCAATRYVHDASGNLTLLTCLDASGHPQGMNGTTSVSTRSTFDANGCVEREESINAGGALVSVLGVATKRYKRDAACGVLSLVQLDESGRPAAPELRASSFEYVRNKEGLVIEEQCHNAKKEPISCRDSMSSEGAIVRRQYDDHGREVLRTGFSATDAPSKTSTSYPHEWRFTYRPDGMSNEVAYFDEHGKPALANGTVAKHAFIFDRLGSLESAKSLDLNGKLSQPTTGCSELRRAYDSSHRLATIECRGPDGALAPSSLILESIAWPPHAARVVIEQHGTGAENAYYDADGGLLRRVTCGAARCYR
jgi:hypothetical protein